MGVGVRRLPAVQESRRSRRGVGKYDEAETFFGAALEEAERIPIKLEQPEVRRWYAKMLIDRNGPGDHVKARELLEEAIDVPNPRHAPTPGDGERTTRRLAVVSNHIV
jgi:hypothetical protein